MQAPTLQGRKSNNKGSKGELIYATPEEAVSSKGTYLQSGEAIPSIEEEDE